MNKRLVFIVVFIFVLVLSGCASGNDSVSRVNITQGTGEEVAECDTKDELSRSTLFFGSFEVTLIDDELHYTHLGGSGTTSKYNEINPHFDMFTSVVFHVCTMEGDTYLSMHKDNIYIGVGIFLFSIAAASWIFIRREMRR